MSWNAFRQAGSHSPADCGHRVKLTASELICKTVKLNSGWGYFFLARLQAMARLKTSEVLRYAEGRRAQGTVRTHFLSWRASQVPPVPYRCDNKRCSFHTAPLVWNGAELKLILDHVNGVCGDNRPTNLQFLCPNCNAQQSTHGGGNKGKVEQSKGGFAKVRSDGKRDYTLPAETGRYQLKGGDVAFKNGKQT